MKQYITLVFILLTTCMHAQTLVNRAWKASTGNPTITYDHLAGATGSNYAILVGNTYSPGQAQNYLVSKYSFNGQLLWQTEYNSANSHSDLGFDVYIKGDYVYVTGTSIDSATNEREMLTLKLTLDSGSLIWDANYAGSYGDNSVAIGITVDDGGNAYVLGGEQVSPTDGQMTVIKYDSTGAQQWVMHYDSAGYIDGAGAILLQDTDLIITGFSGNAFNSWHFVTLQVDAVTGDIENIRLDPNANGSLDNLFSITQHTNNNVYITGSILRSPTNEDIKIVRYDTLLDEVWVRSWGSPDSLRDRPCKIGMDGHGNIMVLGESHKPNGGVDMVLLCYHNWTGELLWQRRLSAPNPAHVCKPGDMLGLPNAGYGMPTYIAGTIYNGTDNDYLTASYDSDGNLRWLKTMNDSLNSDDQALDIQYTAGGIVVSGTSSLGGTNKYVSVRYEEFEKENIAVIDTDSIPQYIDRQVIVWFNPNKVDTNFCADKEKIYTNMGNLIIDTAFLGYLDTLLGGTGKLDKWKVNKVFHRLTPDVKYSISRRGDTIPMPQFWSCFVLHLPNGKNVIEVLDSLKTVGIGGIIEVQANNIYTYNDAATDAEYQNDMQRSLRPSTLDPTLANSTINIEGAWDIETGRSHVKVGVYDSGINFRHTAFGDGTLAGSNIIGYHYYLRGDLSVGSNSDLDLVAGHGSACASIIGAKRNDNNNGMAGIAGGNNDGSGVGDASTGVQLVSMGISVKTGDCNTYSSVPPIDELLMNALLEGSSYSEQPQYGYGINVANMSIASVGKGEGWFPLTKYALGVANRNQVSLTVSSGNFFNQEGISMTSPAFPATVGIDDWVVCVGASGINGSWKEFEVNDGDTRYYNDCIGDDFTSMYGPYMDVIGPGVTGLVWATRPNSTTEYTGFNGTSAAAPHAAGVAGLIMSHINSESMTYGNVAPEDIERILELTATDVSIPPTIAGPDPQSGFGRLNATAALEMIKLPHRQLIHAPYINTTSTRTSTQVATSQSTVVLPNSIEGVNATEFIANVHEVEIAYDHSGEITGAATLVNGWRRNSGSIGIHSSTFVGLGSTYYETFGCEQLGGIDATNATYRTYVYELTHYYGAGSYIPFTTPIWYPSSINNATCPYTLLIEDLTATDIEKSAEDEISVRLTPNPTNSKAFLRYVLPKNISNLRIDLYDISGKIISNIYLGEQAKGIYSREINLDDLSSGLYFVHLYSEDFSITKKLNKQ